MSSELQKQAIIALASFDQIEAGLKAGDSQMVKLARETLTEMVATSNPQQLYILLMAPRLFAQNLASQVQTEGRK